MKKKKLILLIAAIIVIVAAILLFTGSKTETLEKYTLTKIEKGDLEAIVSSTGALSAVTTIQVGTQVSGRIAKLYVDFNDQVKKGQLLAELDKSVLTQAVYDSETAYDRSNLQYQQSELDLKRIKFLFEQQLKTQNDLDTAEFNSNVARTNLKSAKSNVEKAKINLAYAEIYSPIDGTVIERSVDVGQTVAASFSSPTLFRIANDLKKMQIQANVDESDIGQIREKMQTRFTVQAYPNRKFEGIVSQIRLQPQTISNVVNYTVVVNVDNNDGVLLPGMTATLDFIIGQAKGVFKVANASLRIRPSEEMIAEVRKEFEERMKSRQASSQGGNQPGSGQRTGSGREGQAGAEGRGQTGGPNFARMFNMGNGASGANTRRRSDMGFLWYLDENGKLKMIFVRTGITDGQMTEVKSDRLKEGMQVIKSVNVEAETATAGRPPRMMF